MNQLDAHSAQTKSPLPVPNSPPLMQDSLHGHNINGNIFTSQDRAQADKGDYDRIIYLLIPLMYSCKILFYYIYNKVLYIT